MENLRIQTIALAQARIDIGHEHTLSKNIKSNFFLRPRLILSATSQIKTAAAVVAPNSMAYDMVTLSWGTKVKQQKPFGISLNRAKKKTKSKKKYESKN